MYFRFFLYFLNKLFPSFLYIPLYFCVWLGWGLFTSQGVFLYCCILNLLYFWFFVFLYIDRVTRQERSLFTSQDVIFPQSRCTQSCSPFHGNTSTATFQRQSSGHRESVIRRSQLVSVMRLYPNTAKNVHFFWWLCKSDGKHRPAGQFDTLVQFECKTRPDYQYKEKYQTFKS